LDAAATTNEGFAMKITSAALGAAFVVGSLSSASALEIQCAKHNQMVGLLTKKFSEAPLATGTVNQDRYMQLFVSASGSWTIIITKADGESCILAAGENWERLAIKDQRPAA